jgi:hypothetical protein
MVSGTGFARFRRAGDYLVMFDPHCKYAPHATPTAPGVRVNFTAPTPAGGTLVRGGGGAAHHAFTVIRYDLVSLL